MVRDTVAHLRAEGRRVFLDAEHFFDGYAQQPGVRPRGAARRRRGRRRRRGAVRHQRRHAARRGRRRRARRARRDRRPGWASTATTTPAARWPTRWPRSTPAPPTCRAPLNGYGERTGNADILTVVANLELKRARRVLPDGLLRRGDPDRARGLRGGQRAAVHPAAVRRRVARSRTRPACTPAPIRVDPMLYQHERARRGRQRHADARLRHGRPGVDRAQGPRARLRPVRQRRAARPGHREGQGPGEPRLHLRGRRRVLRAAAARRGRGRPAGLLRGRVVAGHRRRARRRATAPSGPPPRRPSSCGPAASGWSRPARATARSTRSTTRCAARSGTPTRS